MRTDLLAIVQAGIGAVDPFALTARALGGSEVARGLNRAADSGSAERPAAIQVIAAGKAARGMAEAAVSVLGTRVRSGVVIAPSDVSVPPLESIAGGHPTPNAGSERGGRRALEIARSAADGDALLVLLSGGASSLMSAPAEGVSLDDKIATTARLLRAGADIQALNTVRKHLSAVKGGWLAAAAGGCTALAISDVVGDDVSVIASGPTVPDATTFEQAVEILRRFGGEREFPAAVVRHLAVGVRGEVPETPKAGDARLAAATTTVIGGRRDAMAGALREAQSRGYHLLKIDDAVVGEARTAAVAHVRAMSARAAGIGRPACIVSSGETTVRVKGRGKGGRNQEFALAAAALLQATASGAALASAGTDGVDGPTDAAGAVADSTTIARAQALGLNPSGFLDDNNAYGFFAPLGDLIKTGPTGTNVGDLQVILLA